MIEIKTENVEVKPNFLDKGMELKKEDKIAYFDNLKAKYQEMLKKFSNFENKCKYLENQVKSLEKRKTKLKSKKTKKHFVGLHNTTASYDNIDDDQTIPSGWKSSYKLIEGLSPGWKQKVYWAPNGRCCLSRINALNRMCTEFESPSEDIEVMKAGLVSDGWKTDANLPEGWMYLMDKKSSKRFMSKDYQFFKSTKQAIKHLGNNFAEEDLSTFLIKFHYRSDISEISWLYDDAIPFPWRGGLTKNRNSSTKGQVIISPDGQVFSCFQTAHDAMEKAGEVTKNDLDNFDTFISNRKYKGKTMSVKLEDGTNLTDNYKAERSKGSSMLVWHEDETVPEGWKVSVPEGFGKRFKDPKGKFYMTRLEALRNIMKESPVKQEDIYKMQEGMVVDGWTRSDSLPPGWFCKPVKGTKSIQYLSSNLQVLEKMDNVIKYMRENKYTEESIDTFKEGNGLQWKTDEDLPDGWRYGEYNNFKQGQLKNYMDPSGKMYGSVRQILKHFLELDPDGEELKRTKKYLLKDGWFQTDLLPSGWYLKQKKSEKGFYYITPTFDQFQSTAPMVQHLRDIKWDAALIEQFQNNYKSLATKEVVKRMRAIETGNQMDTFKSTESIEKDLSDSEDDEDDDVQIGLDWEDDIFLPEGWKTATTKIDSGKLAGTVFKRYMSPCGNHFGNLADALQIIDQEGSVQEAKMEVLKQGLAYEGWVREESLPSGWLSKELTSKKMVYLSPSLDTFSETGDVIEYMQENEYTEDEMQKFKSINEVISEVKNIPKNSSVLKKEAILKDDSESKWIEDPFLPVGWKTAWYDSSAGVTKTKYQKYRNPGGRILSSRAQAIRFILSEEDGLKEDIEKMKNGLVSDGWIAIDFLPKGWMKRKSGVKHLLLTPEFETFKTIQNAIAYMKMKKYDSSIIDKLKPRSFYEDGSMKRKNEEGEAVKSPPMKAIKAKSKKDFDDDSWKDGDLTLPSGWKMRVNELEVEKFLSNKGHTFKNRVDGLKFMIDHRGIYDNEDIGHLENTLKHECWENDSLLPLKWRIRKSGTDIHFLTGIYNVITIVKSARANIRKNFGQAELDNFAKLMESLKPTNKNPNQASKLDISNIVSIVKSEPLDPLEVSNKNLVETNRKRNSSTAIDAKEIKKEKIDAIPISSMVKKEPVERSDPEENETLPKDWRTEVTLSGEVIFINPEGSKFSSRVSAVEFMMKNTYSPEDIYNLWNSLDKEGWSIPNEKVPSGWRIKYFEGIFDYKYLTKEMQVFESTEEAFTHIKDSGNFNFGVMMKFGVWVKDVKKATPSITWLKDSSIPSSWFISSGLKQDILKNSTGSLFEGRKEAIDHMIKENYSPSDIFKLWNNLHLEGWVSDDENLPTGWKRKRMTDRRTYHYLSPMMEVVKSGAALLDVVEKGKEYSDEELVRVKGWLKNK